MLFPVTRPRPPKAYNFATAQLTVYFMELLGSDENVREGRNVVLPRIIGVEDELLPYVEKRRVAAAAAGFSAPSKRVGKSTIYQVLREQFPTLEKPLDANWGGCPFCCQYERGKRGASTGAEKEILKQR